MSQTVIQRLAERIRSFGDKNVTKQAIELSRTAIIDTIGVTLAGSVEPCATNLLRTPGIAEAPGPCALFGTKRKTSALDATFFNGTASHALDYDDFSQPMGGHQSAPLVAPLLAVAEERGLSGAQLIQSYVLGIETEIRLARAVNFHHYDKGGRAIAEVFEACNAEARAARGPDVRFFQRFRSPNRRLLAGWGGRARLGIYGAASGSDGRLRHL